MTSFGVTLFLMACLYGERGVHAVPDDHTGFLDQAAFFYRVFLGLPSSPLSSGGGRKIDRTVTRKKAANTPALSRYNFTSAISGGVGYPFLRSAFLCVRSWKYFVPRSSIVSTRLSSVDCRDSIEPSISRILSSRLPSVSSRCLIAPSVLRWPFSILLCNSRRPSFDPWSVVARLDFNSLSSWSVCPNLSSCAPMCAFRENNARTPQPSMDKMHIMIPMSMFRRSSTPHLLRSCPYLDM